MFVGLLTDLVNASNHAKCVPLSNHAQPTQSDSELHINLHSNESTKNYVTIYLGLI